MVFYVDNTDKMDNLEWLMQSADLETCLKEAVHSILTLMPGCIKLIICEQSGHSQRQLQRLLQDVVPQQQVGVCPFAAPYVCDPSYACHSSTHCMVGVCPIAAPDVCDPSYACYSSTHSFSFW